LTRATTSPLKFSGSCTVIVSVPWPATISPFDTCHTKRGFTLSLLTETLAPNVSEVAGGGAYGTPSMRTYGQKATSACLTVRVGQGGCTPGGTIHNSVVATSRKPPLTTLISRQSKNPESPSVQSELALISAIDRSLISQRTTRGP